MRIPEHRLSKIDLVFGSTGWEFPIFVGCLKAVEETGWFVRKIWASGSGSIPAALFMSGWTAKRIEELFIEDDTLFKSSYTWIDRFLGRNHDAKLNKRLKELFGCEAFKHLKKELGIVVTDFETGSSEILHKDTAYHLPIWKAVRMSCGNPVLFEPFADGKFGFGPLTCVLPIKYALEENLKSNRTLCYLVTRDLEIENESAKSVQDFIQWKLTQNNSCEEVADILSDCGRNKVTVVRTSISKYHLIDTNLSILDRSNLIEIGYKKSIQALAG